jgi:putative transposase
MKRKQFSIEQIAAVAKQAEMGVPMAGLIRHLGISKHTFGAAQRIFPVALRFNGLQV